MLSHMYYSKLAKGGDFDDTLHIYFHRDANKKQVFNLSELAYLNK